MASDGLKWEEGSATQALCLHAFTCLYTCAMFISIVHRTDGEEDLLLPSLVLIFVTGHEAWLKVQLPSHASPLPQPGTLLVGNLPHGVS